MGCGRCTTGSERCTEEYRAVEGGCRKREEGAHIPYGSTCPVQGSPYCPPSLRGRQCPARTRRAHRTACQSCRHVYTTRCVSTAVLEPGPKAATGLSDFLRNPCRLPLLFLAGNPWPLYQRVPTQRVRNN